MRTPLPIPHSLLAGLLGLFLVLSAGFSASDPTAGASPDDSPPALVLISIDTLRADRLPAYGYSAGRTPTIDSLAASGVVFERAYTTVPLTLPAHVSLLSGLWPTRHGVRDNIGYRVDSASIPWLPRRLQQAGYATAAGVSAYVLRGSGGLAEGFDLYADDIPVREGAGVGGLERPARETLGDLLPWLEAQKGRPFFLFFHLFEPHTPYAPPAPFHRLPSPYDGEVAAADAVVGELLTALRRAGRYDSTTVVLLSDHGEGLGEHGEDEHGVLLYRSTLHVPLVLRFPGARYGGLRVAEPVSLVDVAPTLLVLADLPQDDGGERFDGRSLLPLLEDSNPGAERALYAETFYPRLHFGWSELRAVIAGPHQLIEGPDPELYDLVGDPAQRKNLLPQEAVLASELRQHLEPFLEPVTAPSPVSAEERRALAALGYVGGVEGVVSGPLPDPKTRIGSVADLKACVAHFQTGAHRSAVAACERAVEEHPASLDAWEHLGRSAQALGDRRRALAAFVRALDLAEGRAGHLAIASALMLIEARRPEAALVLLDHESPRTPDARPLRLLAARTLVLLGRLEEAERRAVELVEQYPEDADAVYLRGAVRMGRDRFAEAEADLRTALEFAPQHSAALSDLAILLERQGKRSEALDLWRRLMAIRPGDPSARAGIERLSEGG